MAQTKDYPTAGHGTNLGNHDLKYLETKEELNKNKVHVCCFLSPCHSRKKAVLCGADDPEANLKNLRYLA